MQIGARVALAGMGVSGALAIVKVVAGWMGHSTSVVADGFESAGDVLASGFVLVGLSLAAKPPDSNHPYGHGRAETLTGLLLGFILAAAGVSIGVHALRAVGHPHEPPASYVTWILIASIAIKSALFAIKSHYGRKIGSTALLANAWNDAVDMISGVAALAAVSLNLYDPVRFAGADEYGGFAIGLIVIFTGIRVARDSGLTLMDTMPDEALIQSIREVAARVPGVYGVEKCYARKTGLQYHVDLHLEVDPEITVRESHMIAEITRNRIRQDLPWVADVLVHVEPWPGVEVHIDQRRMGM